MQGARGADAAEARRQQSLDLRRDAHHADAVVASGDDAEDRGAVLAPAAPLPHARDVAGASTCASAACNSMWPVYYNATLKAPKALKAEDFATRLIGQRGGQLPLVVLRVIDLHSVRIERVGPATNDEEELLRPNSLNLVVDGNG